MKLLSLLCFISTVILCDSQRSYIYVDSHSTVRNSSCWAGREDQPCNNLPLALEGVQHLAQQDKHPWVLLKAGTYTLYPNSSTSLSGPQVRDFGLVGQGENQTQIQCSGEAGMSFVEVYNVTLINVTFSRCGAVRATTSRNSSGFLEFCVGVYFLLCSNLTLRQVSLNESEGVAILVYSSGGDNMFDQLEVRNSVSHTERYPAAGGLYIEFSYCIPSPGNCTALSYDDRGRVNDAMYHITNSTFVGNIGSSSNLTDNIGPVFSHGVNHSLVGRGGGVAVVFKGHASRNTVVLDHCTFTGNRALWGGGLFVSHQDNSFKNTVTVTNSHFTGNVADTYKSANQTTITGGGGAWVEFVFYTSDTVKSNTMVFNGSTFRGNSARFGGGVGFTTSREPMVPQATNSLRFSECTWQKNTAQSGAAVDLNTYHRAAEGAVVTVQFSGETQFTENNRAPLVPGSVVSLGTLASNSVPIEFKGHVLFYNNSYTALTVFNTPLYFSEHTLANFTANKGILGGAISLRGFAFMQVNRNTSFTFTLNMAQLKGGAIYVSTEGLYDGIAPGNCFVRYYDASIRPEEWQTEFHFIANLARARNSAIYTASSAPCMWDQDTVRPFCWPNWYWRPLTNCTDQVETAPSRFNSTPSESIPLQVYPGIKQNLPPSLHMFDDYGHRVTDALFITGPSYEQEDMQVDDHSGYISDGTIRIVVGPHKTNGTVDLYTASSRAVYARLNVTVLECPTGLALTLDGKNYSYCGCNSTMLFSHYIHCDEHNSTAQLLFPETWVGLVNGRLMAGNTPYTSTVNRDFHLKNLPKNASEVGAMLCGDNYRKGVLCGTCADRYGAALNSEKYRCVLCDANHVWYKWVLYFLTELLPPTLLFLVIMLFNISLTSEATNSFIFFCQMFKPVFTIYRNNVYKNVLGKIYETVYDMWNMNFFDSLEAFHYCIHPSVNAVHLITMEYIVALYPLLLMGVLYGIVSLYNRGVRPVVCLCRPVHHCVARIRGPWSLNTSITHTFAAFLLLSFVKFTVTSYKLLAPSTLYDQSGHSEGVRVYYNGELEMFKGEHLAYATLAIAILVVFVALPTLLLLLFPSKYFHAVLNRISCGRLSLSGGKIELFLNTFYGGFRDGTQENSRDWRCFAGLYFVFRIVMPALTYNSSWSILYLLQHLFCVSVALLFAVVRPYRDQFYNNVDTLLFGLMAVVSILSSYNLQIIILTNRESTTAFVIEMILITTPLLYLLNRLFVKFVYPACRKFTTRRTAAFKSSQTSSHIESSHGSVGLPGGEDSLMKLIDEHESIVKYSEESGVHPRKVQFLPQRGGGSPGINRGISRSHSHSMASSATKSNTSTTASRSTKSSSSTSSR